MISVTELSWKFSGRVAKYFPPRTFYPRFKRRLRISKNNRMQNWMYEFTFPLGCRFFFGRRTLIPQNDKISRKIDQTQFSRVFGCLKFIQLCVILIPKPKFSTNGICKKVSIWSGTKCLTHAPLKFASFFSRAFFLIEHCFFWNLSPEIGNSTGVWLRLLGGAERRIQFAAPIAGLGSPSTLDRSPISF